MNAQQALTCNRQHCHVLHACNFLIQDMSPWMRLPPKTIPYWLFRVRHSVLRPGLLYACDLSTKHSNVHCPSPGCLERRCIQLYPLFCMPVVPLDVLHASVSSCCLGCLKPLLQTCEWPHCPGLRSRCLHNIAAQSWCTVFCWVVKFASSMAVNGRL